MFDQRLSIDRNKRKHILENLVDISGFLGWGKRDRNELMTMSLALGLGSPTPLSAKDGLIRPETLLANFDIQALMISTAMYMADFEKDSLDSILDEQNIYKQTEECLNTGLSKLADFINENISDTNYVDNKIIPEMDRLYAEIEKDFT